MASGKALLDRFLEATVAELDSMNYSSHENANEALQRAGRMVDAMLFHMDDPLGFSELSAEDIFMKEEKLMFEVSQSDDSFRVARRPDGTTVPRAPFLWTEALLKQCMLHLLRRTCCEQLMLHTFT